MADDIRLKINLDGTQAQRVLDQLNKSGQFDALRSSVTKLGVGIGTAFAAAAATITASLKGAIDRADALSKGGVITGIGTEALSELTVAGELADASTEDLIASLGRLNRAAVEAATGGKAQADTFAALGVNILDVNGNLKPTRTLLDEVSDGLAKIEDGALRSALAQEIFGKSGANLLPLLSGGAAGLRSAADEARQFGLVVSDEAGKASEAFNDNLTRLELVARGAANTLANDLIGSLVPVTDELVQLGKESLDLNTRADIREFAENSAIAVAILAEVFVGLAKGIRTVGGSVQVIIGDLEAFRGFVQKYARLGLSDEYNQQLEDLLKEREDILREANARYVDLISYDGTRISDALKKSFADAAKARAFIGPQLPNADAPEADRTAASLARLKAIKDAPSALAAHLKAENEALAEQKRRTDALAASAAALDREQFGRASGLAEGVLTPAEQFTRQVAELNTLVRDGALQKAALKVGLQVEELQNRIILGFSEALAKGGSEAATRANELYQNVITENAAPRADANSVFAASQPQPGVNPRQAVGGQFGAAVSQQNEAFRVQMEQLQAAHEEAEGLDAGYYEAVEAAREQHNKRLLELDRARADAGDVIRQNELSAGIDALGLAADAAAAFGKKGFAAYKAAAIAQALIATYSSATKSYDSLSSVPVVGPALGAAAAAAAVVAGLGQVARIKSQQPAGYRAGGFVTGPGTGTSDSIPAMLSNGEGVLNVGAMRLLGRETLDDLNNGRIARFARGGTVGLVPTSGARSLPTKLNVSITNNGAPAQVKSASLRQEADGSLTLDAVLDGVAAELEDNVSRIARGVDRRTGRKPGGRIG